MMNEIYMKKSNFDLDRRVVKSQAVRATENDVAGRFLL